MLEMFSPKMILLDLMMTPMDGLTFIKTLGQQGKQKDYAIFVITAMDNVKDELKEMCHSTKFTILCCWHISLEKFLKETQEICAA